MMREQFGLETELTVLGRERRLTPTAEIALFRIAGGGSQRITTAAADG